MKTATIERTNPIIPYPRLSEPTLLCEAIREIGERYHDTRAVRVSDIGTSLLGREIPLITLGDSRDNRSIVIVGGMEGDDLFSPAVLIRFAADYAGLLESDGMAYGTRLARLSAQRTVHLIPMLNPDGYAIRRNGAAGIPGADALKEINGGGDFSHWSYNARGVKLAENFLSHDIPSPHAGSRPESEPETAALISFLTMAEAGLLGEVGLLLTLGKGNGGLIYTSGDCVPPRSKTIARLLSRMTGCPLTQRQPAGYGPTDWFIRNTGKPAVAADCSFDPDLNFSDPSEFVKVWAAYREALFTVGLLI